jgi:hypothetical protein
MNRRQSLRRARRFTRHLLLFSFAFGVVRANALIAAPAAPVPLASRATLVAAAPGLDPAVLGLALDAVDWARSRGELRRDDRLTVIDYSLPSTEPRLWVFDLASGRLLFRELVAHGVGSGDNYATRFSNRDGSRQTSLGLFRTGDTYQGANGYSMRLHGLEAGTNDLAFDRTIVVHGAWYVSEEMARRQGRLGRSWGCPALSRERARPVIDTIRGGSLLFAYYPEPDWLAHAAYSSGAGGVSGVRTAAR